MKKLLKIVAVLLVLLLVGAGIAYFYIDHLVKSGVEHGATNALGVQTTVGGAKLGIAGGKLELNGLHVSNPQGFDAPHFMTVDDSALAVTLPSLLEDRIEAPTLKLDRVDIHLQRRGLSSNYHTIMDHLAKLKSPDASQQDGKTYVIREVTIDNIIVHVDLGDLAGDYGKLDLSIPQVKLNNYGDPDSKGLAMEDLTAVIIKAVLEAAVQKSGGKLPPELAGDLSAALAKVHDFETFKTEVVGQVEQRLQERLNEELGEGTGKLLEGVGDLLKKPKGEEGTKNEQ